MDILYLLIPLSAVLVLAIIGVFGWALYRGQFEDLEHEGERILQADGSGPDAAAGRPDAAREDGHEHGHGPERGHELGSRRGSGHAVSPASDGSPSRGPGATGGPPVDLDQSRR